jgi:ankyrin repeat protein
MEKAIIIFHLDKMNDLCKACRNGDLELVKELREVDPSQLYNLPFRLAVDYGHIEVVKYLLTDPRVNPADNDNSAIGYAALKDDIEMVSLLLQDSRVNPAADDNYALRASRTIEMQKLLLTDPRVDPNILLDLLIYNREWKDILEIIDDPRIKPGLYNNLLLCQAVLYDQVELVRKLLSYQAVLDNDLKVPLQNAKTDEIKEMIAKAVYRVDGQEYCKMKNLL